MWAGPDHFTVIDCGAWIERNLSGCAPIEKAQVAALSMNEARIYQLTPRDVGASVATVAGPLPAVRPTASGRHPLPPASERLAATG